jgi:hypothetical protein
MLLPIVNILHQLDVKDNKKARHFSGLSVKSLLIFHRSLPGIPVCEGVNTANKGPFSHFYIDIQDNQDIL